VGNSRAQAGEAIAAVLAPADGVPPPVSVATVPASPDTAAARRCIERNVMANATISTSPSSMIITHLLVADIDGAATVGGQARRPREGYPYAWSASTSRITCRASRTNTGFVCM
jgi:hypothetical protein